MHSQDKYKLKPSLSEKFKGIIWKIETDSKNSTIAVETREVENRIASYSAFNYRTGETLFKEISVENSWLWSIDVATNNLVFLHSYATEQSPEHKGIIALNARGEIQWQLFNKTVYDVSNEGLVAYNPNIQPRALELLSFTDGSVQKTAIKDYKPVQRQITYPQTVSSESLSFIDQEVFGPVFHLLLNDKAIYAYHVKLETGYQQELLITTDEEVLLKDNLTGIIPKLNPEAFFIEQSHLFCIRDEKREIVSYLV